MFMMVMLKIAILAWKSNNPWVLEFLHFLFWIFHKGYTHAIAWPKLSWIA